ncbi:MAG TPA: TIGR02281 family clan AA aspartic protease, partial [Nitrolancea sp.]|nr:TIGR02281 family clan AA aspartic protease [Nitrolancea sp.]
MSSATASLFASFAIAALGAASLAYTLTHPGVVAGLFDQIKIRPTFVAKSDADTDREAASGPAAAVANQPGTVTLPAGQFGHFLTEVEINGRDIGVMVDTGASLVALTYDDAERAGIFVNSSDFTGRAQTANGTARVARVTISRIQIGDIT